MITPRFHIGQELWFAKFESSVADYVTCPECGGTGQITCILFDDTRLSVECRGCQRGYEAPTGTVVVYRPVAGASWIAISGIEIDSGKVEYRATIGNSTYTAQEADLFLTKEDALSRSEEKKAEYEREQLDRIARKEKDGKSWSWHVHYHRDCIRRAERDIAYHTSKLDVAKVKAKEAKVAA